MTKIASFLSLFIAVLQLSSFASAQASIQGTQFRQERVVDESLLRKGRIELGLSIAGGYSTSSVTPDGGSAVTQSNLYIAPALVGGYMVTDNIEVRLSLGLQTIHSSVGGATTQDIFASVLTVQGLYEKDFVLGLAGYVGVGLGGYYGWRNVPNAGGNNDRFNDVGGVGQLLVGLLMQPSARLMLRGGLRLDVLFGGDSPDNDSAGLPSSKMFNVQGVAELAIGWRFN